jgi:hypothetical protein
MSYERCTKCDELTGKAGPLDDSLFDDDGNGPFCERCWDWVKQIQELTKQRDNLLEALFDIAEGNVSKHDPTFMRGIENDTRESFQERLNSWFQKFARNTIGRHHEIVPTAAAAEKGDVFTEDQWREFKKR